METFDQDKTENTATPRGAGGDLQSKALLDPSAGAADAPQHQEGERQPEASEQATTADD